MCCLPFIHTIRFSFSLLLSRALKLTASLKRLSMIMDDLFMKPWKNFCQMLLTFELCDLWFEQLREIKSQTDSHKRWSRWAQESHVTSEDAIRLLFNFSRFTCLNSEASETSGWNAIHLHLWGSHYSVEMTQKFLKVWIFLWLLY